MSRTLSGVPVVALVYKTTSEMRTPHTLICPMQWCPQYRNTLIDYDIKQGKLASYCLGCCLFIASNELNQAQDIAASNQNTSATLLDVHSDTGLGNLVKNHNLVVR